MTKRQKIIILKRLLKTLKKRDEYGWNGSMCNALVYDNCSPESLGLVKPKKDWGGGWWYSPQDFVSRYRLINRIIKKLQK